MLAPDVAPRFDSLGRPASLHGISRAALLFASPDERPYGRTPASRLDSHHPIMARVAQKPSPCKRGMQLVTAKLAPAPVV